MHGIKSGSKSSETSTLNGNIKLMRKLNRQPMVKQIETPGVYSIKKRV